VSARFVFITAAELGPYVEGLRAIERETEYPIGDGADAFTIDHGPEYHPFFTALGDDARFLLALEGERVVGGVVGVGRKVRIRGRMVGAVYGGDWKVAADHRGDGTARRMMLWGSTRIFTDPSLLTWRYAYVAAMRGENGDVMRAAKGLHPGRLGRPAATLAVYFVDPARLAALSLDGAPPPPAEGDGIDLSYVTAGTVEPPGLVSTAGRKDLRLRSTGEPWPSALPTGAPPGPPTSKPAARPSHRTPRRSRVSRWTSAWTPTSRGWRRAGSNAARLAPCTLSI
jgi:hypothetical protein